MSTDVATPDDTALSSGPTIEQREQAARRAHRLTGLLIPLVFAGVFCGGLATSLYLHRRSLTTPTIEQKPPVSDPPALIRRLKDTITETVFPSTSPAEEDIQQSLVEMRRVSFLLAVAQSRQAVNQLRAAAAEWETLLASTLHDDGGRRIAGSQSYLARFIVLRDMERPVGTDEHLLAELESMLDQAEATTDVSELSRLTASVLKVKQNALTAAELYEAHHQSLVTLRGEAAATPLADNILEDTLNHRAEELSAERRRLAELAAHDTQTQLTTEHAELENSLRAQDTLVMQLTQQLQRLQSGGTLAETNTNAETPRIASREAYLRELKLIRSLLKPFITPGYAQPKSANEFVYATTKTPMSYNALSKTGALANFEAAPGILFRIGGSKSATQSNDRPLGTFPRMNSPSELQKPAVLSRLKDAQRLLRDYGLLMVDDGLLSP